MRPRFRLILAKSSGDPKTNKETFVGLVSKLQQPNKLEIVTKSSEFIKLKKKKAREGTFVI